MHPRRLTTAAVHALAGLATLALAGTCAAHLGGAFKAAPAAAGEQVPAGSSGPPVREEGRPRVRLANSGGGLFSFIESLFGLGPPRRSRDYRPSPPSIPRSVPRPEHAPVAPGEGVGAATYRTMCVRLCDGYYWPVSFATVKDHFGRDAETCARSCGAPAALYYYPNPGGEPEDMVGLDGQPYKSLGTAFLYRATYDASCKCRAHPWEDAATERHKGYAKSGETKSGETKPGETKPGAASSGEGRAMASGGRRNR